MLPVTLGFYDFDFDELLDFDFNEQFGTASFLPGVEVDIPVLSNWMLIPNAHLGVETEVQGEDYATIYSLGTKSRLRFPTDNAEFMLGNALTFAGYAARDGVDDSLSRIVSGLNYTAPLGTTLFEREARLGLHVIHFYYFNRVNFFSVPNGKDQSLRNEFELAVSLGSNQPWNIFGFSLERLGIGVRYGDDFRAVRLVGGLPY